MVMSTDAIVEGEDDEDDDTNEFESVEEYNQNSNSVILAKL